LGQKKQSSILGRCKFWRTETASGPALDVEELSTVLSISSHFSRLTRGFNVGLHLIIVWWAPFMWEWSSRSDHGFEWPGTFYLPRDGLRPSIFRIAISDSGNLIVVTQFHSPKLDAYRLFASGGVNGTAVTVRASIACIQQIAWCVIARMDGSLDEVDPIARSRM
jgi:hypothetical protein